MAPGQAELRDAAILITDLRGFCDLATRVTPAEVMQLLASYQAGVVDLVTAHCGSIDKFIGDGILASFGATMLSDRCAADALRAADDLLAWATTWQAECCAAGVPAPPIGLAVATGRVMFGAIGHKDRLEYTIIGEPVNLAAKLEKHTKIEQVRAIYPLETYDIACSQGYQPAARPTRRYSRATDGIAMRLDLVVAA
jgi:adenylate cyclase